MKTIITAFLALSISLHAETVPMARADGANISQSPFITALGGTTAGKALFQAADAAAQKTTLSLNNVENTALSTWTGTANITTLGTITTGTVPAANVSGLGSAATATPSATGLAVLNGTPAQGRVAIKTDVTRAYASGGSLASMRMMLDSEKSCGLALIGDSTSEGYATKWPDMFLARLAAEYPAFGVKGYRWSGSAWVLTRDVAPPNGDRYWGGTVGQTPVIGATLGPGDFQLPRNQDFAIELKVSFAVFSDLNGYLVRIWEGNTGASADRLMGLSVDADKKIRVIWYDSANAFHSITSGSAMAYNATDVFWIRAEVDMDNGAAGHTVTFKHRATDDASWTPLGDPTVTATASSLRTLPLNNAGSYVIITPIVAAGSYVASGAKVYRILFYDQLDPLVGALPIAPIDHFDRGATSNTITLGGSPTLTVRNGAVSGYGLVDYMLATDPQYVPFNKLFFRPDEGIAAGMVSIGHNGNAAVPYSDMGTFALGVKGALDNMQTRFVNMSRIYVTQNPQNGTGERGQRHGLMMARLAGQAGRDGDGLLNAWQVFQDDSRGLAALMADALHPNADGYALWADTLWDAWDSRAF